MPSHPLWEQQMSSYLKMPILHQTGMNSAACNLFHFVGPPPGNQPESPLEANDLRCQKPLWSLFTDMAGFNHPSATTKTARIAPFFGCAWATSKGRGQSEWFTLLPTFHHKQLLEGLPVENTETFLLNYLCTICVWTISIISSQPKRISGLFTSRTCWRWNLCERRAFCGTSTAPARQRWTARWSLPPRPWCFAPWKGLYTGQFSESSTKIEESVSPSMASKEFTYVNKDGIIRL